MKKFHAMVLLFVLILKEHRTQGNSGKTEERTCWKAGIAGQGLVSKRWKIVVNCVLWLNSRWEERVL